MLILGYATSRAGDVAAKEKPFILCFGSCDTNQGEGGFLVTSVHTLFHH